MLLTADLARPGERKILLLRPREKTQDMNSVCKKLYRPEFYWPAQFYNIGFVENDGEGRTWITAC